MKTNWGNEGFGRSRGRRAAALGLFVLTFLLPGCSEKQQAPAPAAQATPTPGAKERVVIKGSNTVGEELAPRLIAEFKKDNPKAGFDLETKGTGSGFWGLIGGVCDIAAASRTPIKDEQQQAQARNIELSDHVIGSYSVAVIVNANNPVKDLSKDQVRDIFMGVVQNWKDIGGPDAPVHLYSRDPISGTYLGFRELALEDNAYSTNLTTFTSYAGIVQAVAKDPNGIGYSSLQSAGQSGVKAVSIGGVVPLGSAVNDGKYPFARVLHLYTNKAKETSTARDFILFVQSARGQALLDEMGFVRKP